MQQIAELIEYPDWIMYGVANACNTAFGPFAAAFENVLASVPGVNVGLAWINDHAKNNTHALSKKLPLMTPGPMLFTMFMYIFVLALCLLVVKIKGSAFGLRQTSFLHNFFLTLLSLYMMTGITVTAAASFNTPWNQAPEGKNDWRMAKFISLFYLSKIIEFGDTWLMALRGHRPFEAGSKISFLHTYHHASIFPIWFFVTLAAPGGDAWWSAMANSFVHVIMYAYMAATCLDKDSPTRKALDSIKFYITKMQMFQFALNAAQSAYLLWFAKAAAYPRYLIQLLFWYMWTLLALFYNFLEVNTKKSKKQDGGDASGAERKSSGNGPALSPARPAETKSGKKKQ